MSAEFDGLVAVVTGGASGIGLHTATVLVERGATVACLDLKVDGVVPPLHGIQADVTDDASVSAAIEEVVTRLGRIDILVNNAGIGAQGDVSVNGDAEWHRVYDVNVVGIVRVSRAALPHLRKSPSPRIVNIASTEALGATALHSPYSAAKAGVTGLTRSLAVELGRDGITVNCICPGPITTGITERISDEHKVIFAKRRTVLRRYGDPEEVAHMTLSLCLPAASYITGAVIPVDGGLMARNA